MTTTKTKTITSCHVAVASTSSRTIAVPFLVKVAGDTSFLSDEEGLDDDDNEDENHH
jgi:hypothetical protein